MVDTTNTQIIDWLSFPIVPDNQKPRQLYHTSRIAQQMVASLKNKGWEPTDCRLMPDNDLNQRATAVLAWLSGVRMGSIIPEIGQAKFIEMEMRCCGLYIGKQQSNKKDDIQDDDLESILSFGKKQKTQTTQNIITKEEL
jgi:hypothetical protein